MTNNNKKPLGAGDSKGFSNTTNNTPDFATKCTSLATRLIANFADWVRANGVFLLPVIVIHCVMILGYLVGRAL